MENHDAVINNSALQAYPNALNQLRNPDTNIKFKLRMKFKSIQAAIDMKKSVKTALTQQRRA